MTKNVVRDFVIGAAIDLVGWAFCFVRLAAAFAFGHWAAGAAGTGWNPDGFGLLSALAVLWVYGHQYISRMHGDLHELLSSQRAS